MLTAETKFISFMIKRENLKLVKASGAPWPWSSDDILNKYKFTNVKREDDRTTRWMRRHWTGPNFARPHGEIIFNCALFRYFGTSEFAEAVGWQSSWAPHRVVKLASDRHALGERVFTGAYIIPTLGHRGPKAEAVAHLILTPLWASRNHLAYVANETSSWKCVADVLRTLPGFGGTGFMAKEVLQDVIHTPVLRSAIDRDLWCPAGPGARRGLNRIYNRVLSAQLNETLVLDEMIKLLHLARTNIPPHMPELELHDIQFQLCEFDKYERVRLKEGRPRSLYRVRPTISI